MADLASVARAIEGARGHTAGNKGFEEIDRHLERAYRLAAAGRKDAADDTPGRREAASAAFQREIPAERAHEGGDGQKLSNEPHGFEREFAHTVGKPATVAEGHPGDHNKLKAAAGVPSRGNAHSVAPSGGYPSGAAPFRTVAGQKASAREKLGDGNRESVDRPATAPLEPRVGEAPAPAKAGSDANRGEYEREPQYVGKERLGATSWERAAEGARKLLKAPRR